MSKAKLEEPRAEERRKFERVDIARDAQVSILRPDGKKVGVVLQIGRGGFMMAPEKRYTKDGKTHRLTLHEPSEQIHAQIQARVLYTGQNFIGFEFVDLDADAAVEIGIIIGKFYEARHQNQ